VNDDSQKDSYGDTCTDGYDAYPEYCGGYDTDMFISSQFCCACGGGYKLKYFEDEDCLAT
jgi:hypothetical protein